MQTLSKIKRLSLREIWAHEAGDFTPWLAENITELGDAIGIELELQSREADVGEFSLDLLAKDLGTGSSVIIENQLTQTDHDHLGKLITYASGFDASIVVWIAESIRDEHRQALEWLNQKTDTETSFFGVIVEVLQIEDSKPAFNFDLVVLPNEWQKKRRIEAKRNGSTKSEAYRRFFQSLIDELREEHKFTGARLGQPQSWYTFASGISGVSFASCFCGRDMNRVELYLERGDAAPNKSLFDWLFNQKEKIEKECGFSLEWQRLDDKQSSRICVYREGSIEASEEGLVAIRMWQIERLLIFKKVFGPLLKEGARATVL